MGPGQKRALPARPGNLETSAGVAFLQAACLDLAVGDESAHVACVIHDDVAVVEVVESYVGGGTSGFFAAGETAEDRAVGQDWVGVVAPVEFQSGDVDMFDRIEAVAAVTERKAKSRKLYGSSPLHIAIFYGRLLSRAALADSAVRVSCKDEN